MKHLFAKMLVGIVLVISASFASAATCAYNPNNGVWYGADPSCNGLRPNIPLIPIQGNPGLFNAGGNLYHCPALASWGGGILGALVGSYAGKNIDNGRLRGLTTLLGAVAGNQISCELVRPANIATYTNPYQGQTFQQGLVQQGVQQIPQIVHVPSDCGINGHPDLQNLKGLTEAQCGSINKLASTKVSANNLPQGVQMEQAYCPIYGPGGKLKKVANPDRRNDYCGELIRSLQKGDISWEDLQVVSTQ